MGKELLRGTGLVILLLLSLPGGELRGQGSWWNASWRFRVPVTVDAGSYERYDKPAEVQVNFTGLLASAGESSPFDENSLRVVEVDGGGSVVDPGVDFQFDKAPGYDAASNAAGTLVLLLNGVTPSGSSRLFHVYFEVSGSGLPAASIPPRVTLTDDVLYEGQLSLKIQSASTTYYYHKRGGGFAGMKDRDNLEWLGFDPTPGSGSGGEYRGIPNMVFNISGPSFFHPGFTNSSTTIVSEGPLKVTFRTVSNISQEPWEGIWEVYPDYARMTVAAKGTTGYWFLYEGTPGGSMDPATDFVVRSNGVRNPADESWEGDLPAPEWVYFGDGGIARTLFLAHHTDDSEPDSYRQQDNLMTVFGFGRTLSDLSGFMGNVPNRFTIGFAEDSSFSVASKVIASAYRDIAVTLGAAEKNTLVAPTLLVPPNGASFISTAPQFVWTRVDGASGYHLQVATDQNFISGVAINDTTLVDTVHGVTGLAGGTTYYWRVRARSAGQSGAFSPVFSFSTSQAAPELRTPGDSAAVPDGPVGFVWSRISGASTYQLQVTIDPSFVSGFVFNDPTLTDTVKQVAGLAVQTRYYWRVGARSGGSTSFSSPRTFVVTAPPPQLVVPLNNQSGLPTTLSFSWRKTRGATRYLFELATDSTFVLGIVKTDSAVADTFQVVSGLTPSVRYYWHVAAKGATGLTGPFSETRTFTTGSSLVAEEPGVPRSMFLDQNYPNPFNPSTNIRFGVAEGGRVTLEVFTVLGERVATLVEGYLSPGTYTVSFVSALAKGGEVRGATGLYLYRLAADNKVLVRKMLLVK